jgi:hypothetical protein
MDPRFRGCQRSALLLASALLSAEKGSLVSMLKVSLVLVFALALIAFAAFGGGWKWHDGGGKGHAASTERVAGSTWTSAAQ